METCDQNAVDGFSFSQDLTSGLSQMTTQSTDSGFYGDSQSLKDSQSLSQSFGGARCIRFAFFGCRQNLPELCAILIVSVVSEAKVEKKLN